MKGLGLDNKHYNDGQHIVRLVVANWLVGIIIIIDKLFSFVIDRKVCFDFAIYMECVKHKSQYWLYTKYTNCTSQVVVVSVYELK